MAEEASELREFYNTKYRQVDYFKYRSSIYRPFIRALASKARLRKGCSVLDAGCGQGFFAYATNLCPKKFSERWIHHSIDTVRKHFDLYSQAKIYFSLRIETIIS